MAKRQTSTEKWDDPFFFDLPTKYKLFWLYLLDKCNNAGIWEVNKKMAEFCIDEKIEWDKIQEIFPNRIELINGGKKWFIKKFIQFQYKQLDDNNKFHHSIIALLRAEGLYKGLTSPLQAPKYKDKDIYINKKNKDNNNTKINNISKNEQLEKFENIWNRYPRKEGKPQAQKHFIAQVSDDQDWADINTALGNYVKHIENNKTEYRYIKMGSTWFNHYWKDDWLHWREPGNGPLKDPNRITVMIQYLDQDSEFIKMSEAEELVKEGKLLKTDQVIDNKIVYRPIQKTSTSPIDKSSIGEKIKKSLHQNVD